MRQAAAMVIRMSLAIATVATGLAMASSANAQGYLVDGRAASTAEVRYLVSQGMPQGNWRIDGWGIGPAEVAAKQQAVPVSANSGGCFYVLDVLLGDCAATSRAVAERAPEVTPSPEPSPHVERAAADAPEELVKPAGIRHAEAVDPVFGADR